jgi:molecular chaperone GrpE
MENDQPPADEGAPARNPAEPAPQTVEDVITQLESQIQGLEKNNRELKDHLLRTAADFDNFRKRTKKEIDDGVLKGREGLVKEVIPVLDNLERALGHAATDDPLAQGVRMVEKQLLSALEKFGVTRFTAEGQAFDPAMHDAIQQVETQDLTPGTVAQEFSKGYTINGRLLRPAMVAVAKAPAQPERSEG